MRVAVVAPAHVPAARGGAEQLAAALVARLGARPGCRAELVTLAAPEDELWGLVEGYEAFARLDLSRFDLVISTKYPSWMVRHPRHVCYMLHRLRGLYDTYHCHVPGAEEARHPAADALREHMRRHAGQRSGLAESFGRLRALRAAGGLHAGITAFPGPFARDVVRYLDDVGLAPTAVTRYAAISRNVRRRAGYFPPGVEVAVLPPPPAFDALPPRGQDYLFTIGRLDGAKRTELVVRAMRHVKADVRLRIAGRGPEQERLRELARGDARIECLGAVDDADVPALYADALAVVYVPYDEDYGLVTVEAMRSGKPVVTARDAGGPLEFVEHGVTGLVAEPEPRALAAALDRLAADRAEAAAMGERARARTAALSWDAVLDGLLGAAAPVAPHVGRPARPRLTVAVTYPVHPPRGGGQFRLYHLYRHLARRADVEVCSLGRAGEPALDAVLAPGLREVRTPPTDAHVRAEAALSAQVGHLPVTDVAAPALVCRTPAFGEALQASAHRADLLVAAHPYLLDPLLEAAPGRPFVHDSQNVEWVMKRDLFPDTPAARRLVEAVRELETRCCRDARLTLACSPDDLRAFRDGLGAPDERLLLVPNGLDAGGVPYTGPDARRDARRRAGVDGSFLVAFLGSWHPPNLDAVEFLLELAPALPEMRFVVVGSVGMAFGGRATPENLGFLGVVDDATRNAVLSLADAAVNPVRSGSGTNIKTLDAIAAGVPLVTTPFGARGLELGEAGQPLVVAREGFAAALAALRAGDGPSAAVLDRARAEVEARYDWGAIASALADRLGLPAPA